VNLQSTERFDVIVVGLGPAGTAVLWHLAQKGFKVLGIEMRSRDRLWGKPCGDAIGAHHFDRAKLPKPPARVVKNKVKAIDIYAPGLRAKYRVHGEGYIIDRKGYGLLLLDDAISKGARVELGATALEPIVERGRVSGVVFRKGERVVQAKALVVVDATGMSQKIVRQLPNNIYLRDPIRSEDLNIAYREVVETGIEVDEHSVLRIYLDKDTAPGGYWWLFPEGKHLINLGLGVQGGRGYPHPSQLYYKFIRPAIDAKYKLGKGIASGAPVPTRRPANTLVGEGLIVIGDAGYTVNPLHGGGMGYSFYAAYLAAKAFEEAYDRADFSSKGLWSLNVEYMRSLGRKQAALDVFRRFLQELGNDDIAFAMERRILPEADVYDVSASGELKMSIVEKALVVIRGLRRPTLLLKLKTVAEYMSRVRECYDRYPDEPIKLSRWVREVEDLLTRFSHELKRGF
jgi:geranylgeranyl reductase family protein